MDDVTVGIAAGKPREATVTAVEHLEALRIPADDFQAFLQANPQVAVGMLKSLVERLREVQDRLSTPGSAASGSCEPHLASA